MSTITEREAARKISAREGEKSFWLRDYSDELAARTAFLAAAPTTYNSLPRVDSECSVEEVASIQGIYLGTAVYRTADQQDKASGDFTISFDISGQNTKLTQAYTHIADYAPTGKVARNFHGAINVTSDGVDGVDVLIPTVTYTVNYTFDSSVITDGWVRTVARIVGKQNNATFKDFEAGELLLTKISGTQNGNDTTNVSFGFAFSENRDGIVVGSPDGDITDITKGGWDYMWVFYEERTTTDGDFKYTSRVPVSVHVEQVYPDADFTVLGI